ncbi:MAG: hypothetical protein [Bacteriophage sp.]|nr:MAG: hypothetical protein [Bacteriophage sp.]
MARYMHPSVDSKIVDNSFVYQTADGTTALIQVILSEKGPDSTLVRVTTDTEYVHIFGEPNLQKYGQAGYNVINWLKGGGVAYVIRVLPATSTYAVGSLFVQAKTVGSEKVITLGTFGPSVSITSIASAKEFITANTVYTDKVSPATIPLGIMLPKGRGTGYNDLGYRLSLATEYDATFAFRTYNITITTKDDLGNNEVLEGPFLISFDPDAKSKSRESLYWVNVLNKYSEFVTVIDNPSAFEKVTGYLLEKFPAYDPAKLDFIFKRPTLADTNSTVYSSIRLDSTTVSNGQLFVGNSVNYFTSGKVGEWTGSNTEESLLVRAYQGLIDPAITDPNIEFDIALDANFSPAVKNAISELCINLREDTFGIVDLKFQANEQQTVDYRKNTVTVAHRNVAVFAHDMQVFDPYSGQSIKVTSPYLLATKIPENDNAYGVQYPFVGPRRGAITGFENINFIPNPIWRETFYAQRINYIERDPKKINFGTQLTSQAQNSALSDINNMRVLLKIRREVTKMLKDYRMEFSDATTYESINYNLAGYLQTWISNRACSSISGNCYASEYDKMQKQARVDINLTFTGIIERFSFQLIVNR